MPSPLWGSGGPFRGVASGNMGQPALEPHVYISPSLGPCCLPSETPKSQVGGLLTRLSLSRRRASESSLSSESSESSDAGESQGTPGGLGGLPESPHFPANHTNIFPTTGSLHLPTSGGAPNTQPRLAERAVGRGPLGEKRSYLFKTRRQSPRTTAPPGRH